MHGGLDWRSTDKGHGDARRYRLGSRTENDPEVRLVGHGDGRYAAGHIPGAVGWRGDPCNKDDRPTYRPGETLAGMMAGRHLNHHASHRLRRPGGTLAALSGTYSMAFGHSNVSLLKTGGWNAGREKAARSGRGARSPAATFVTTRSRADLPVHGSAGARPGVVVLDTGLPPSTARDAVARLSECVGRVPESGQRGVEANVAGRRCASAARDRASGISEGRTTRKI